MCEVIVHGLAGGFALAAGRQLGEDVQMALAKHTHQLAGSGGIA